MFSPDVQSVAARLNPRRRTRQTSEESSSAPRPSIKRRKRSALAHDTFEPLANGHAKLPNGHHKDGPAASPEVRSMRSASVETATQGQQLAHRSRGSKRGDKKGAKREAGLLQADTDHYSVWKENDLPQTLKEALGLSTHQTNGHSEPQDAEPWRADLSTKLGYAVAFTRKQAVVWPYGQGTSGVDAAKVLNVKLPFQTSSSRYSKDALPLGALVHDTGAGELGLLAVAPSSGKLVYWESVASAANAAAILQKQHGAHGAVSGLFSGENVTSVAEAEPDSFVLATSYGRVAHVTVRDLQGRPHISSTVLRGSTDSSGGGLFGSFKNVFSSGWRKEIAGVRAGPMRGKSGRQCIVVHANGQIQTWSLERHASKTLESDVDAAPLIHGAISIVHPDREPSGNDLRILDFTYFSKPREGRPESPRILLLCGYAAGSDMFYYLVEATQQRGEWEVQVVHPVSCWSTPPATLSSGGQEKLRVLLPDPEHTAYVIGSQHIILLSLVEIEQTPESQLQMEAHTISEPFQDVLRLDSRRSHSILACGVDPTDRNPEKASCIMLVDNYGFARASATPVCETESSWDRRAYLCKSHIEQGVFFGCASDNLLDFSSTLDKGNWTDEEVEKSAIEVSDSIMENRSKRITPLTPSMEQQLQTRALWLRQLINYVKPGRLSHPGRWHMLWSAEKIAAAEALWLSYSELLRTKAPRDKPLLPELLDMISEKYKHENNPELGETDIVRHYLLNDVAGIELLILWADKAVQSLEEEGHIRRPDQEGQLMRQASDIVIVGLSTAFEFRARNCQTYGITPDLLDNGIYQGDHSDLPYFWTSAPETPEQVRRHTENVCMLVMKHNAILSPRDGAPEMPDSLLGMIASDAPVLIETCCRVYEERCRWLEARTDEDTQHAAKALREQFVRVRKDLLLRAQELELDEDAFRLAECYGDMDALAEMLARAYDGLAAEPLVDDAEERDMARRRLAQLDKRTTHFFATYGEAFATAAYDRRIETGQLADLLARDMEHRDHLTRYLRQRPQLRKLSWINDALLGDFSHAADSLVACGKKDDLLWARKVDFSLAKLSALAALETQAKSGQDKPADTERQQTGKIDRRLALVTMQEELHAYTRPILGGAIDVIAEADLAMDSFGAFVKGKPYLQSQLRGCFEKLGAGRALDADELVDCLTLLSPPGDGSHSSRTFEQRRFFAALQLLDLQGYGGARRELLERTVWRRCLLQDNWAALNATEAKTDEAVTAAAEDTALFTTVRAGYKDGFFDTAPPPEPSAVEGAGTTAAALREAGGFEGAPDEVVGALAADLEREDAALRVAAKKGRLEMWWPGVVSAAKLAVRRERDEEGESRAAQAEARRAFEQEIAGGDVAME